MNNLMFDRQISVHVAGETYKYPDYNINFHIPDTVQAEPDVVEISIWNLSDASIGAILDNAKISVVAGYKGDVGTVFTGRVEQVLPEWQGVDKITTLLATNTGSKLRSKEIKKTYKAGTKASFIIKDLSKHLDIKVADLELTRDISYEKGLVVDGSIYNQIRKIAIETDSKLYTKDNQIYVRNVKTANKTGVILDHSSGLIGSPVREEMEETDDKGKSKKIVQYRVDSLLNHRIRKDDIIQVNSRVLKTKARVIEITHTSDFKSEILIRP